MNWSAIAAGLDGVVKVIEEFAPVGAVLGPAGAATAALVQKAAAFADAVLQEAQGASAVISATDLASIEASASTLRQQNDALAEQIASS